MHTLPNEDFPLRVDGVTAGWAAERRPEDVIPAARPDAWQLVYVRSGTIEERCDDRRVLLRAGGLLFHQPAETFGMRPVGEVPPDVLRLDFLCTQAGMDRFRGAVFHAEPQAGVVVVKLIRAAPYTYIRVDSNKRIRRIPHHYSPFAHTADIIAHCG